MLPVQHDAEHPKDFFDGALIRCYDSPRGANLTVTTYRTADGRLLGAQGVEAVARSPDAIVPGVGKENIRWKCDRWEMVPITSWNVAR